MNEILTREKPYQKLLNQGLSYEDIFEQVCDQNLQVTTKLLGADVYADKINVIIKDCLKRDPEQRPSCSTIRVKFKSEAFHYRLF